MPFYIELNVIWVQGNSFVDSYTFNILDLVCITLSRIPRCFNFNFHEHVHLYIIIIGL